MKKIILKIFAVGLFCFLAGDIHAQQTIPAAGDNASGSGGSVSYTIGQVFYSTNGGSPNGAAEQGVQIVDIGSNPLPIKLISFTGVCNNGKAQLNWETASEDNNEKFIVEKSEDAVNWLVLATVKGAGTSSTTSKYNYIDPNPNVKAAYYRLQQVDANGNATYSNTVNVMSCGGAQSSIVLYPNPTYDGFFISMEDFTGATYQLSDVKGSMLRSGTLSGSKTYISLSQLSTAAYFITIAQPNNQTKTFKIFKQ